MEYLRSNNEKGYRAGGANKTKSSMKGFTATSGSAHTDIDESNNILRSNARSLYMTSPLITSAVDTLTNDVVGCGLKPNPNIDYEFLGLDSKAAAKINLQIKRLWKIFSKKNECDSTLKQDFYELENLIFTSAKQSGDCFVLLKFKERPGGLFGLKLHVIEADRVSTPDNLKIYGSNETEGKAENGNTIYDGVEVGEDGEVVAYYISKYHPADEALNHQSWDRLDAYDKKGTPNILHFMQSERPDQYRGVAFSAKIIELGVGLKRYDESTRLAAHIANCLTYWIKRNSPDTPLLPDEKNIQEAETIRTDPDDVLIQPGSVNSLADGEEVQTINPTQPTTAFPQYMDAMYKLAGAATGQGGEKLMHSFNASYSASRATLEEAWKYVLKERAAFITDICEYVYELFISECVARGYVNLPGYFQNPLAKSAYLRCTWVGQAKGSLDPLKETNSAILQIKEGIKTRQQITLEMTGGDWEENIAAIKRENEILKEAGLTQTTGVIEYEETDSEDDKEKSKFRSRVNI